MMIMIMIIIKVTVKNHDKERAHGNDLEAVSGKVRSESLTPNTYPPKHPPIGPEAIQGPIGPA